MVGVLATKALPAFEEMKEQHQVELIQRLAEITPHMNAADAKTLLPPLYDLILTQIPLPPAASEQQEDPKINFSIVESALYIFHTLAAKVRTCLCANSCAQIFIAILIAIRATRGIITLYDRHQGHCGVSAE